MHERVWRAVGGGLAHGFGIAHERSEGGLLVLIDRSRKLRPGELFACYVLGYGIGRLWVEALRSDHANTVLGLRVNIWTSLIALVGGLLWLFWRGSPVDREATERLRAGTTMAQIIDGDGVRAPLVVTPTDGPGSDDEPDPSDGQDPSADATPSDDPAQPGGAAE